MILFSVFSRLIASFLIAIFVGNVSAISLGVSAQESLQDILPKVLTHDLASHAVSERGEKSPHQWKEGKETQDIKIQKQETREKEEYLDVDNTKKEEEIKREALPIYKKLLKKEETKKKSVLTSGKKVLLTKADVIQKSVIPTEQKPEISSIPVVISSSAEIQREKEICVIPAEIPKQIQKDFAKATENIPCHLLQSLRKVEIFEDPRHIFPRAMANGRILKIRSDAVEQPEFVNVLIHELGHVVDLGGLKSTTFSQPSSFKDGKKIIYGDDKSVLFYEISWINESQKKPGVTDLDFIGGYSSQDMFEDYAESFLMYIEHGNDFRMLATQNTALEKKYNFFRDEVFDGEEFFTGDFDVDFEHRDWDITKYK